MATSAEAQTCVIAPCLVRQICAGPGHAKSLPDSIRRRGLPVILLSVSPKGRAERRAFHRARGAMCDDTPVPHMAPCAFRAQGSRCPLRSNGGGHLHFTLLVKAARHGSRKTPAFRTRWTLRLAASPRRRRFCRRLSRSCRLLPGHALGPSARVAGCHPQRRPAKPCSPSCSTESGIVAATAARST